MARAKKADDKTPAAGPATVTIEVDSLIASRNAIIIGLNQVQDALSTLQSLFTKRTNEQLGEHAGTLPLEIDRATNLLNGGSALDPLHGEAAKSPVDDVKKEKRKRAHDPMAPKRPLTPYFLYMQTARPIIAQDLGPDVAKGAVSTEGVTRWNAMLESDKQLWTQAYTDNLKLYHARMHSYKAGNLGAKDMSDDEAAAYAEANQINVAPEVGTVEDQLVAELEEPAPEPEPEPEAVKTPKAKATRKSKGKAADTPATATSAPAGPAIVPPPSAKATPAAVEKEKSPDKKRKRGGAAGAKKGKDAEEAVASVEAETETPKAAPKPRKSNKKAKTDA